MDFTTILQQLSQLSEATKETPTGKVHKAEPGGYGRKFDTDEEGDEKKEKKPEVKRGRGRPKKGSDETGEVKKYDWSAFGVKSGKDIKLPKHDKSKTVKHSLKEYLEKVNEAVQMPIPVVAKQGDTQSTGAGFVHIDDTSPAGKAMANALGDLAQQKKAQIVVPTTQQTTKPAAGATGQAPAGQQAVSEKWGTETKVSPEEKGKYAGKSKAELLKAYNSLKEKGPHEKGSPEYGRMRELAFAIRAKTGWGKVKEADIPPTDSLSSPLTLEEGMEHRHKAARHAGKAHALAKEGYNCRYDDMEEMKAYHEGYKEGLDECYGVMPVQGLVVGEETPAATVPGMAQQAMEADVEEGNAFTAALAKTPKGGKFSVGGKTFTDRSDYNAKVSESPFAFEAWDNQLNELLNEGMSVSVSTGQPGMPETVNVNATDGDADKLLAFVKQVGLGGLGQEEPSSDYGSPKQLHGDIKVVDDHDGMMSLIKKMTGNDQGSDYADEKGGDHEESCDVCGEAACKCEDSHQMVDEVESEDQMTYEVAEDNAPDSDEAETSADEDAEAKEDAALAGADSKDEQEVNESEEELTEWANDAGKNGTDTTFEQDIEYMTKILSGGLNKPKSTGQTTIPVIASQTTRQETAMSESKDSLVDWLKLSGLK